MKVLKLSSSGTHPIRVPIFATQDGLQLDPSAFPVQFAFPVEDSDDPEDGDYTAGEWELIHRLWHGRFSVSGLAEGRYDIWCWVDAGPNASPRARVGVVEIT